MLAIYYWAWGLPLSGASIHSETLLTKTHFLCNQLSTGDGFWVKDDSIFSSQHWDLANADLYRPCACLHECWEIHDNQISEQVWYVDLRILVESGSGGAFNPSNKEPEAGGSLWVQGQPGLQREFQHRLQSYRETLSWKTKIESECWWLMYLLFQEIYLKCHLRK